MMKKKNQHNPLDTLIFGSVISVVVVLLILFVKYCS